MRYLIILFLISTPALAQVEVETPNPNVVDFSPIINQLIGVMMIILTGVLAWVGAEVRAWLSAKKILTNEKTLDTLQSRYDQASLLALSFFETLMIRKDGKVDWAKVDIASPFLKEAATWMIRAWPDTTKDKSLEEVMRSLYARIPSGEMTEKALEFSKAKAGGGINDVT